MKEGLYKRLHIVILIIVLTVTFFAWLATSDGPAWSDLFVNLLASCITILFTSLVIDKVLKLQREKEIRPLMRALYRDVTQFKSELVDVWSEMYQQSIVDRTNITIEELFSKDTINNIFQHLDLEGKPCLFTYNDWYQYLNRCSDNLKSIGNKILEFYTNIAPPELLDTIHYLVNNSVFTCDFIKLAITRRKNEIENNIPSRPMINTYTPLPRDKDYLEVGELLTWCKEYGKKLYGDPKIKYTEKVIIIDPDEPPTSILSEEKKEKIEAEWIAWQESCSEKSEKGS